MATIRVQLQDGRTGTMDSSEFNPQTMKILSSGQTQSVSQPSPQPVPQPTTQPPQDGGLLQTLAGNQGANITRLGEFGGSFFPPMVAPVIGASSEAVRQLLYPNPNEPGMDKLTNLAKAGGTAALGSLFNKLFSGLFHPSSWLSGNVESTLAQKAGGAPLQDVTQGATKAVGDSIAGMAGSAPEKQSIISRLLSPLWQGAKFPSVAQNVSAGVQPAITDLTPGIAKAVTGEAGVAPNVISQAANDVTQTANVPWSILNKARMAAGNAGKFVPGVAPDQMQQAGSQALYRYLKSQLPASAQAQITASGILQKLGGLLGGNIPGPIGKLIGGSEGMALTGLSKVLPPAIALGTGAALGNGNFQSPEDTSQTPGSSSQSPSISYGSPDITQTSPNSLPQGGVQTAPEASTVDKMDQLNQMIPMLMLNELQHGNLKGMAALKTIGDVLTAQQKLGAGGKKDSSYTAAVGLMKGLQGKDLTGVGTPNALYTKMATEHAVLGSTLGTSSQQLVGLHASFEQLRNTVVPFLEGRRGGTYYVKAANAYIPQITDSKQTIQTKLAHLQTLLDSVANLPPATTSSTTTSSDSGAAPDLSAIAP